jgi:hypothetical protein
MHTVAQPVPRVLRRAAIADEFAKTGCTKLRTGAHQLLIGPTMVPCDMAACAAQPLNGSFKD